MTFCRAISNREVTAVEFFISRFDVEFLKEANKIGTNAGWNIIIFIRISSFSSTVFSWNFVIFCLSGVLKLSSTASFSVKSKSLSGCLDCGEKGTCFAFRSFTVSLRTKLVSSTRSMKTSSSSSSSKWALKLAPPFLPQEAIFFRFSSLLKFREIE